MYHEFLNPACRPTTLDIAGARRAILVALQANVRHFSGTVLDIGCGDMPYKSLFLQPHGRASRYIGLDLPNSGYARPDVLWDGRYIPLGSKSVEGALATELFEHCPAPEDVMREALRVLRPGGCLFFSVPFLWPLHCSPHDEYRYTPFSLERHLRNSGFVGIDLKPSGGWDASLAQMIGLWVRRRPMGGRLRQLISLLATPLVGYLNSHDRVPAHFADQMMMPGICGVAFRPPLAGSSGERDLISGVIE